MWLFQRPWDTEFVFPVILVWINTGCCIPGCQEKNHVLNVSLWMFWSALRVDLNSPKRKTINVTVLNTFVDSMDNYRVIVEHISVDNGFKHIYKKMLSSMLLWESVILYQLFTLAVFYGLFPRYCSWIIVHYKVGWIK